jgi:hypothetical protein
MWLWRKLILLYFLEKNMSKLKFSMTLLEDNATISNRIATALLPQIKTYFQNSIVGLDNKITDIVINSITSQPEYNALLSGSLQYEFGIPDPSSKLTEILDTIKSNKIVQIKSPTISGSKINASIRIEMIQSSFNDLLQLGSAKVLSEKGTELNWLRWLLLEGDTIIISDYKVVFGANPRSRTGMAVMTRGGSWRVPPEYAGNIKNNWITRAIDAASSEIDSAISSAIGV